MDVRVNSELICLIKNNQSSYKINYYIHSINLKYKTRRENYNEIKAAITQECIGKFQAYGIKFSGIDEESRGLKLAEATSQNVIVNLQNLIEYYITGGDKNAVDDFVLKIIEAINPTNKRSKWDEVKNDIFILLYPDETDNRRPFAKI